jgi:hypothetical protein
MNLIRFEFGVMISIWFCYVYDMVWVLVWIWFWNVLDVNLIWFGNGAPFSGFPTGWLQERKQKQCRDSLLVDVSIVFVVLK